MYAEVENPGADDQIIRHASLVRRIAEVVDIGMSEIETALNVGNEETSCYIDSVASCDEKFLIPVDLNKLSTEAELGKIESM